MYITRKIRLNAWAWYVETAEHAVDVLYSEYSNGVRFYFNENQSSYNGDQQSFFIWAEFATDIVGTTLLRYQRFLKPAFEATARTAIKSYTISFKLPNPNFYEEESDCDAEYKENNNVVRR